MQRYCEHCRKYVEARRAPFSNLLICSICGTEFGADYLTPGTIISGFRIEVEIGRGSFGIVYKALQLNLERMVALKILSDELSRDADFVDNFFREARLAASLSHPNIVQAFDAGATPEGIYYFAMELIEGETLDARISRAGRLQQSVAIDIALKIARAMEYAWDRQKLTHGDIKPENIIINSSGEAKLADLGLAKTAHEESSGSLMVTPLYAPPEVISAVPGFDPVRADIYSFGGTFYHMLAGTPPFNEDDPELVMQMHVNDIPISLAERLNIHPDLSFITDRMLAKNPDERPRNWQEIISFLEAVDLTAHRMAKSTRRAPLGLAHLNIPKRKSTLFLTAAILASMALVLFIGVMLIMRGGKRPENFSERRQAQRDYEWNKLKTDIKFLSERKALELVTRYVETRKNDAPQDALQTLEILRKESELAEYRDRIGADFDRELKDVIRLLKTNDLVNTPAPTLINLQARIINLFKLIGENKFLYHRMSGQDKRFLDEKVKLLKDALIRYDRENKKKWIAELNKRKQEYREKVRRQEDQQRIANDEIDHFYLATFAFNELTVKNRNAAATIKLFANLSRKDLPKNLGNLLNFVRDIYKEEQSLTSLLINLNGIIRGTELPEPNPYPGYKISSIDDNFINLESRLDYGVLKKRVRLAQLKSRYKFDIIEKALTPPPMAAKLTRNECFMILRVYLDYQNHKKLPVMLDRFYQLSEEEKGWWKQWDELVRSAPTESDAIRLWQKAVKEFNSGHYPDADELIRKLHRDHAATELWKRIAPAADRLTAMALTLSPELQARQLLEQYGKAAADKNTVFQERLALIMTLRGRYSELKSLPERLRLQIAKDAATMLNAIPPPPKITLEEYMASPADFEPGTGRRLIDAYKPRQAWPDQDRKQLELYAALDVGNWSEAAKIIAQYHPGKNQAAGRSLPRWLSGPEAAMVLTLNHYGAVTARQEALTVLQATAKPASTAITGEDIPAQCDLLRAQLELGIVPANNNAAAAFPYNSLINASTMRLAWLNLAAMLAEPEPDPVEITKKLQYYQLLFDAKADLLPAAGWFKLLDHLFKGICDPTKINNLKTDGTLSDPMPVKVTTDAAAYLLSTGKLTRESVRPLLPLLEQHLGNHFFWSDCEERIMLLKLALADSWSNLFTQSSQELNNHRMTALPHYPRLLLFHTGVMLATARLDNPTAAELLSRMLNYCPIAAPDDIAMAERLNTGNPADETRQQLEAGKIRQGFWCGLLLTMRNYYHYETAWKILEVLNAQRGRMNWEQRAMLSNMEKLLAETPE